MDKRREARRHGFAGRLSALRPSISWRFPACSRWRRAPTPAGPGGSWTFCWWERRVGDVGWRTGLSAARRPGIQAFRRALPRPESLLLPSHHRRGVRRDRSQGRIRALRRGTPPPGPWFRKAAWLRPKIDPTWRDPACPHSFRPLGRNPRRGRRGRRSRRVRAPRHGGGGRARRALIPFRSRGRRQLPPAAGRPLPHRPGRRQPRSIWDRRQRDPAPAGEWPCCENGSGPGSCIRPKRFAVNWRGRFSCASGSRGAETWARSAWQGAAVPGSSTRPRAGGRPGPHRFRRIPAGWKYRSGSACGSRGPTPLPLPLPLLSRREKYNL
jgi:hypothetical protein